MISTFYWTKTKITRKVIQLEWFIIICFDLATHLFFSLDLNIDTFLKLYFWAFYIGNKSTVLINANIIFNGQRE